MLLSYQIEIHFLDKRTYEQLADNSFIFYLWSLWMQKDVLTTKKFSPKLARISRFLLDKINFFIQNSVTATKK